MKILMCVEQEWVRRGDALFLVATYEDGHKHTLVGVEQHPARPGWFSWNDENRRRWDGPFATALQAVRWQRQWYMPFRKLCQDVARELAGRRR